MRGLLDRLNRKKFDWDTAIISITKDRNMYEVSILAWKCTGKWKIND